ncbi:hypothetical protein BTVI_133764 [Pitangus sulphuratus]|nr:hypothetical protein BTVI_133764 [Pitangus sulphuratus]
MNAKTLDSGPGNATIVPKIITILQFRTTKPSALEVSGKALRFLWYTLEKLPLSWADQGGLDVEGDSIGMQTACCAGTWLVANTSELAACGNPVPAAPPHRENTRNMSGSALERITHITGLFAPQQPARVNTPDVFHPSLRLRQQFILSWLQLCPQEPKCTSLSPSAHEAPGRRWSHPAVHMARLCSSQGLGSGQARQAIDKAARAWEIGRERHTAISTPILPVFPHPTAVASQLLPHRMPSQDGSVTCTNLQTRPSKDDSIVPDKASLVWSWVINGLLRENAIPSSTS